MDAGARKALADAVAGAKAEFAATPPKIATRVASQKVLEKIVPALPFLIGGSADLTGSNGTRIKHHTSRSQPGNFAGNYIHYGVREHAMAAAMNGMALHGGIVPYGGTFLVFTDYCRPAIRLSALMGQRVIYVMTHDSIGLGEDGPTHQPIEHLAALRAMPNLNVFRPADPIETAECWELALAAAATPSILALTRQAVPPLRTEAGGENRSSKGAYVLAEAEGGSARRHDPGDRLGGRPRHRRARSCSPRTASARRSCRCPAGNCSRRSPLPTASRCWAPHRALASKPASEFGWERWLGDQRCVRWHGRLRRLRARGQAVRTLRHHRRPSAQAVAEALEPRRSCLALRMRLTADPHGADRASISTSSETDTPTSTSRASACSFAPISTCRSRTAR